MKRAYLNMSFAALCWAGAFVAGKIGSASVSGLEMSFYRNEPFSERKRKA